MPRLELQNLLKPTTTPEQEIFLTDFYNKFDNRSAANRQIINVEPLYYQGAIAASEFLVYAATKMYICYKYATYRFGADNSSGNITLYDETNTATGIMGLFMPFWNTTLLGMQVYSNMFEHENFIFSRISISLYTQMKFTGYRVTLQ